MFKKTFVLMISLVFVLSLSGLVLAANNATVDQVSTANTATITQSGINNDIDLDQVSVGSNASIMNQNGEDNAAKINQWQDPAVAYASYRYNTLNTKQVGNDHSIKLDQDSKWTRNIADIQQKGGNSDKANI